MKKILISLLLAAAMLVTLASCSSSNYKKALSLIEAEDYEAAYDLLVELDDYKDSKELLAHFYWVPTVITESGATFECTYNEKNLPAKILYPDGSYDEYTYDENANITEMITHYIYFGATVTVTQEYDEDGNRTKMIYSSSTGYMSTTTYYYNDDLMIAKFVEPDDGTPYSIEFIYDESKILTRQIFSYQDGEEKYAEFTYDERGNLLEEKTFDLDGAPVVYSYTYDKNNNVLSYSTLYEDGIDMVYQYTYDENNRVIKETYLSEGSVFKMTEFVYDQHGNVISHAETDRQGVKTVTTLSYRLVYLPFDLEDGVTWPITRYRSTSR